MVICCRNWRCCHQKMHSDKWSWARCHHQDNKGFGCRGERQHDRSALRSLHRQIWSRQYQMHLTFKILQCQ